MSKRYRLLKDLPGLKAGTVFEKCDDVTRPACRDYAYKDDETQRRWWYHPKDVENNPEWFSEILPEEKSFDKYRGNLKDDYGRIIFEISESGKYIVEEYKGDVEEETKLPEGYILAKKSPAPSTNILEDKKAVLFVTEDGVEIRQGYSGDLWRVFIVNHSYEMWKPYNLGMPQYINSGEEKYFSTEKAANEYVAWNKPQFSLAGIMAQSEFCQDIPGEQWYKFLRYRLTETARQKSIQSSPIPESKEQKTDRIEVSKNSPYQIKPLEYAFMTNSPIPKEKFNAIKSAIERELNNEVFDHEKINQRLEHLKEIQAAREQTWEVARAADPSAAMYRYKFPTLMDYLKILK